MPAACKVLEPQVLSTVFTVLMPRPCLICLSRTLLQVLVQFGSTW